MIFHELSPVSVTVRPEGALHMASFIQNCPFTITVCTYYWKLFPSHFIQRYIDCDHYLFAFPDYRLDDKKKRGGGEAEEAWLTFFHNL